MDFYSDKVMGDEDLTTEAVRAIMAASAEEKEQLIERQAALRLAEDGWTLQVPPAAPKPTVPQAETIPVWELSMGGEKTGLYFPATVDPEEVERWLAAHGAYVLCHEYKFGWGDEDKHVEQLAPQLQRARRPTRKALEARGKTEDLHKLNEQWKKEEAERQRHADAVAWAREKAASFVFACEQRGARAQRIQAKVDEFLALANDDPQVAARFLLKTVPLEHLEEAAMLLGGKVEEVFRIASQPGPWTPAPKPESTPEDQPQGFTV